MAFIRSEDAFEYGDAVLVPGGLATYNGRYTSDHRFTYLGPSEDQRDTGIAKIQDPESRRIYYVIEKELKLLTFH